MLSFNSLMWLEIFDELNKKNLMPFKTSVDIRYILHTCDTVFFFLRLLYFQIFNCRTMMYSSLYALKETKN